MIIDSERSMFYYPKDDCFLIVFLCSMEKGFQNTSTLSSNTKSVWVYSSWEDIPRSFKVWTGFIVIFFFLETKNDVTVKMLNTFCLTSVLTSVSSLEDTAFLRLNS